MEEMDIENIKHRAKIVLLLILKGLLIYFTGIIALITVLFIPITYIFWGIYYPIGFKLIEYVDDKIKIKY